MSAMEAVRYLVGRGRTTLATGILEGLQLVDVEGTIRPQGVFMSSGRTPRRTDRRTLHSPKPGGDEVNDRSLVHSNASQPL